MVSEALLPLEDYALVRIAARNMLARVGILSNPGYSDKNILDALREVADLERLAEYDESTGDVGRRFMGEVAATLGHLGVEVPEPVTPIDLATCLNDQFAFPATPN